jgi:hypothetical protein
VAKAIAIATIIFLIWFDFFEVHFAGKTSSDIMQWFQVTDATPLENVPGLILSSMLHPKLSDKDFHHSLFNHTLSCILVHLFQFFDVLTYKQPQPSLHHCCHASSSAAMLMLSLQVQGLLQERLNHMNPFFFNKSTMRPHRCNKPAPRNSKANPSTQPQIPAATTTLKANWGFMHLCDISSDET